MLEKLLDFSLAPKSLDDHDCADDFLFVAVEIGVIALNVFHHLEFHRLHNVSLFFFFSVLLSGTVFALYADLKFWFPPYN